jgi:hypothetical protein
MSRKTYIYLVTNCYDDPNKVYVGKTINRKRENDHKRKFGKNINFNIIEEINSLEKKHWKPLETKWIKKMISLGFDIQNKQIYGGSGVSFHTKKTKEKIKLSKSKNPHPNMRKDIEKQKHSIIKKYIEGNGVHVISKQLGCHSDVIKRILRENNVKFRSPSESQKCRKGEIRRKDLWEGRSKIKSLYLEGKTFTELGRMFNTSDVQIKLILKKIKVV